MLRRDNDFLIQTPGSVNRINSKATPSNCKPKLTVTVLLLVVMQASSMLVSMLL